MKLIQGRKDLENQFFWILSVGKSQQIVLIIKELQWIAIDQCGHLVFVDVSYTNMCESSFDIKTQR